MQEQIEILREEKWVLLHPTPVPEPLKYVKKETQFYDLNCLNLENNPAEEISDFNWRETVQNQLEKNELPVFFCYNPSLKKAALLTRTETSPGGALFKIYSVDTLSGEFQALKEINGHYLGNWCRQITAWTKTNDIYYECGGGDGPWENLITYQLNLDTKEEGIIESCFMFEENEDCYHYCDSNSDCQNDDYCDQETSSCLDCPCY